LSLSADRSAAPAVFDRYHLSESAFVSLKDAGNRARAEWRNIRSSEDRLMGMRTEAPTLFRTRGWFASLVFINGFGTIALLALLAMVCGVPLVFPSVGPTAFLLFASPEAPSACPRNTLCGHAIGIVCGYGALWLTGLQHTPSAMLEGVNLARVIAAALSLAATGALMILFRVVHSPAGATTLIISLGIITQPFHLLAIEAAVALVVIQVVITFRLRGIPYPLWSARPG
jgi:CBS domain-containing membrane protein